MKHRLERVNELIRRELGDLITREFRFEGQLVTVQQVDVTPDLKHAHIYVSVIGADADRHKAMASLHDSRVTLQRDLAKRVILKYTPQLHFKLDDAIVRGTRVLSIIDELEHPKSDAED
jgi:ribosome-binding factor A